MRRFLWLVDCRSRTDNGPLSENCRHPLIAHHHSKQPARGSCTANAPRSPATQESFMEKYQGFLRRADSGSLVLEGCHHSAPLRRILTMHPSLQPSFRIFKVWACLSNNDRSHFAVNNFTMRTKLSRLSPPSAKSLPKRGIASLSRTLFRLVILTKDGSSAIQRLQ